MSTRGGVGGWSKKKKLFFLNQWGEGENWTGEESRIGSFKKGFPTVCQFTNNRSPQTGLPDCIEINKRRHVCCRQRGKEEGKRERLIHGADSSNGGEAC